MPRPPSRSTSSPLRGTGWLSDLADQTTTAVFVLGENFLWVNRAGEQLSGYSAAELYEMSPRDLVHPDSRHRLRRPKAGAGGGRFELKVVRKNGQERWVDLSLSEIEVEGEPVIAGTALDVTERKLAELALVESDERLKLAQRAGRSVSWAWDPVTDRLDFALYANELFGFPVREIVHTGDEFLRFIHPDDRERLGRALRRTLRGAGDLSVEIRCIPPDGSVRWLAEKALAIRDETGWVTRVIGVAQDITERKIAEEALFQEKERALVTLASIADGVIRTDAHGKVDYLNPVAQRLTGWTLLEAYGNPVEEVYRVIDHETGKPTLNPVERCLREKRDIMSPGDGYLLRRDGERFAVHDSAAPIRSRSGNVIGAILVCKDLTRLREVEKQMARLESHDPLTGLANRRAFKQRLQEAVESARAEGRRHALCFLDLDQFKVVNDTCGHAAGDQMILQIAACIGATLGGHDLFARIGGDEFGLLLPDRGPRAARRQVKSLLAAVAAHRFSWHERIYTIGVSAGLVTIDRESRDSDSLLSAADAACSVAKERGGNQLHAYEPGDTVLAERYGQMQWISRIHEAFDQGRFAIFRQRIEPLTDTAAPPFNELCIRLLEESGSVVEPEAFIPSAEKYGLISAIDRWMVGTVLDHLASSSSGEVPDSRFAINLSGQSLGDQDFLGFVVERFDRSQVAPGRIHFEITETSAIADMPHALRFISVLKEMGCRFVLDDFGKGLSSFGYLQNLPVDFLKIDGEFVRNLTSDPVQAALVASIHDIGRVLGLRTIAEAVEDKETLDALRKIGVDYVQGFLLSRPRPLVPAAAVPAQATASATTGASRQRR